MLSPPWCEFCEKKNGDLFIFIVLHRKGDESSVHCLRPVGREADSPTEGALSCHPCCLNPAFLNK